MTPSSALERLLSTAPGFRPVWERLLADGLQFEPLDRRIHEFTRALGLYMCARLGGSDQHELGAVLVELEQLFDEGDGELDVALRIGLMESLARALLDMHGSLAAVTPLLAGPASRAAWTSVCSWAERSPGQG